MRILFLDLASHSGLLACVTLRQNSESSLRSTEEQIVAAEQVDHRIGDHELIPLTEKLLADARLSFSDLTHVACVTGPGGFTSLRVAVAFANALAHELKIPAAGVHLSELYRARTPLPGPLPMGEGRLLWLHSTKKHELFVRGFGEYAELWPEAIHISVEDLVERLFPSPAPRLRSLRFHSGPSAGHPPPEGEGTRREFFFCGELLPEHRVLLEQSGAQELPLKSLADALPAFLARQTYEQKLLEPWYGRAG